MWQNGRIKDLPIKIIDGDRSHRYPKVEEFQKEGIIFLNSTMIKDNKLDYENANFISDETFAKLTKGKLKLKDIVLTTRGNGIGKVVLFNNPKYQTGFINAQMLIFRPDARFLDPVFLYYFFCGENFQRNAKNFATGSAQPQLPIQNLNNIEIFYPIQPNQRKIAAILSTYDNLIENNTRRINILEEMAQTIYREWFINFRFPGHEGVLMVESELGLVPEGWEIQKISDVCEKIYSGGTPNTKIPEYWDGGIPWLSSGETRKRYIISTDKTITAEGRSNSSTQFVKAGTTVIASAGQGQTRGQTSLLMLDSYINQSVIALMADEKQISNLFLFFDLSKRYPELRQISDSNASRGSLTTKSFVNLNIVVPPKSLIDGFTNMISNQVNLIIKNRYQNTNLHCTRDLLLPKLINGEIDVSKFDIGIPEAEA
jgi:type I restriction enzyme S subunit